MKEALLNRAAVFVIGSFLVGAILLTPRAFAATFIVNSTLDTADATPGDGVCDDGAAHCTLRAAIQEANALAGTNKIGFNIPGGGVQTIILRQELPALSDALTIDGFTQPGAETGIPLIELKGTPASPGTSEFIIASVPDCLIQGLTMNPGGVKEQ